MYANVLNNFPLRNDLMWSNAIEWNLNWYHFGRVAWKTCVRSLAIVQCLIFIFHFGRARKEWNRIEKWDVILFTLALTRSSLLSADTHGSRWMKCLPPAPNQKPHAFTVRCYIFFSTSLFCCNINVFPPYFKLLTVTDIIKFVVFLVPTLNLPVYITLPFYRTIFPTIAVLLLFFLLMLYVFVCSTLSNLSFESGGCVRAYNAKKSNS